MQGKKGGGGVEQSNWHKRRNEKCVQNFVKKYDVKQPCGRYKYREEDITERNLKETGCKDVHWVDMVPDLVWCRVIVKT